MPDLRNHVARNSNENFFTLSPIDSGPLGFHSNATLPVKTRLNPSIANDTVWLEEKYLSTNQVKAYSGGDTVLILDRSVNQKFVQVNIKTGKTIRSKLIATLNLDEPLIREIHQVLVQKGYTRLAYDSLEAARRRYEKSGSAMFKNFGFDMGTTMNIEPYENGYLLLCGFNYFIDTQAQWVNFVMPVVMAVHLDYELNVRKFSILPYRSPEIPLKDILFRRIVHISGENLLVDCTLYNAFEQSHSMVRVKPGWGDISYIGATDFYPTTVAGSNGRHTCGHSVYSIAGDTNRFMIGYFPFVFDRHGIIVDTLILAKNDLDQYQIQEDYGCFTQTHTEALQCPPGIHLVYELRKKQMIFYPYLDGVTIGAAIIEGRQANGYVSFYSGEHLYYYMIENGAPCFIRYRMEFY